MLTNTNENSLYSEMQNWRKYLRIGTNLAVDTSTMNSWRRYTGCTRWSVSADPVLTDISVRVPELRAQFNQNNEVELM